MIGDANAIFKWWFGTVEDREDPKQLGRVRVRVFNAYSDDKTKLPTNMLPWATVIMPPHSAGIKEVGISPTGLMVGSTVFGFFADGEDAQMPIVLGSVAGIPDGVEDEHEVPQLARGKNNVKIANYKMEPPDPYAAKYPYNKVMATESGHVVELDDTPGAERIRILHKSGTYSQVDYEGTRTDKTVGDKYEIIIGSDYVNIKGMVRVIVEGDAMVSVAGAAQLDVEGETTAVFLGPVNAQASGGDVTINNTGGDVKVYASNLDLYGAGNVSVEAGGALTLRGSVVNIQGTLGGVVVTNPQSDFVVTARNVVSTASVSTTMSSIGATTLVAGGSLSMDGASVSAIAGVYNVVAAGAATVTAAGALTLTSTGAATLTGTNGTAMMA